MKPSDTKQAAAGESGAALVSVQTPQPVKLSTVEKPYRQYRELAAPGADWLTEEQFKQFAEIALTNFGSAHLTIRSPEIGVLHVTRRGAEGHQARTISILWRADEQPLMEEGVQFLSEELARDRQMVDNQRRLFRSECPWADQRHFARFMQIRVDRFDQDCVEFSSPSPGLLWIRGKNAIRTKPFTLRVFWLPEPDSERVGHEYIVVDTLETGESFNDFAMDQVAREMCES